MKMIRTRTDLEDAIAKITSNKNMQRAYSAIALNGHGLPTDHDTAVPVWEITLADHTICIADPLLTEIYHVARDRNLQRRTICSADDLEDSRAMGRNRRAEDLGKRIKIRIPTRRRRRRLAGRAGDDQPTKKDSDSRGGNKTSAGGGRSSHGGEELASDHPVHATPKAD